MRVSRPEKSVVLLNGRSIVECVGNSVVLVVVVEPEKPVFKFVSLFVLTYVVRIRGRFLSVGSRCGTG